MQAVETTDKQLFTELVSDVYEEHQSDPSVTDWELYESLKQILSSYDIDHHTGIRIITETLEI